MRGERMERDIKSRREIWDNARERARALRWAATSASRVEHPRFGTVVVPHLSNLAALENAAEYWGCDWLEISDAKVWAAFGETPVNPPADIMK